MSTVHELTGSDSAEPQPTSSWLGADGPTGPGGGPGGFAPPPARRRRAALVAGAVVIGLAAGAGSALAASVAATPGPVLSVAQIARKVDPGLVDVVSRLGY